MVGQCEMFVTRLICATETLDLCSNVSVIIQFVWFNK